MNKFFQLKYMRKKERKIKSGHIMVLALLLSMFFVIKFSDITMWSWAPGIIQELLLRPTEGSDAYEVWAIINNLSLAYITSVIFYFIIQYIPKKEKARKAFGAVKSDLEKVYDSMSFIIRMILFDLNIDKAEEKLNKEDVKLIREMELLNEAKYADIKMFKDCAELNIASYRYNLFTDINTKLGCITKTIEHIFSIPIAGNLDEDLIELLSEIRELKFISFLSNLTKQEHMNVPGYININLNLDEYFMCFIEYHIKLKKKKIALLDYEFRVMTPDEIDSRNRESFFMMGRSAFFHLTNEKVLKTLGYITSIPLESECVHRITGVLLEILFTYEEDKTKYKYLLQPALNIAQYLDTHDSDDDFKVMTTLNRLQVIKRMRKLTKDEKNLTEKILHKETNRDEYKLGAAIILGDYVEASRIFKELDADEQKCFIQFPIYRLWKQPPLPADVSPPLFNFFK